MSLTDHGPNPYVVNIEDATLENDNYRTTLWTGSHMQLTVMSLKPGDVIGLVVHAVHDQFLRDAAGKGLVQMGPAKDQLDFEREVGDDWVILVPAGSWHNVTNIGDEDLKVYSLYGPPEHAHGTVHPTKADANHDH